MRKLILFSFLLLSVTFSLHELHSGGKKRRTSTIKKVKKTGGTRRNKKPPKRWGSPQRKKGRISPGNISTKTRRSTQADSSTLSKKGTTPAVTEVPETKTASSSVESLKTEKYVNNLSAERPKPLSKEEAFVTKAAAEKSDPEDEKYWESFDKKYGDSYEGFKIEDYFKEIEEVPAPPIEKKKP